MGTEFSIEHCSFTELSVNIVLFRALVSTAVLAYTLGLRYDHPTQGVKVLHA